MVSDESEVLDKPELQSDESDDVEEEEGCPTRRLTLWRSAVRVECGRDRDLWLEALETGLPRFVPGRHPGRVMSGVRAPPL